MNDFRLDTRLVAATPSSSDDSNAFTAATMQRIRMTHTFVSSHIQKRRIPSLVRLHKIASAAVIGLIVGLLGFTGYAYANGTNPVSLITRIVTGNNVTATYQKRTFQYGKSRSYSDAAITAYAELNTVQSLAFRANNAFGAPTNGVEYFGDVHGPDGYIYPMLATVTSVQNGTATLTEQYLLGDKMTQSHDLDTPLTVSTADIQYYANGNPAQLADGTSSQLVALFPQKYLRHTIATNSVEHVTVYFAFALSHPLDDFKEAAQPTGNHLSDPANVPLYEPSWGGESDLCYNNPADTCSNDKIGHDDGQGMYGTAGSTTIARGDGMYNPNAIYAAGGDGIPDDLLQQSVQGKIEGIGQLGFSLRTSSGQIWKISYSSDQQQAFATAHSPLKIGDTIAVGAEQSISDLNNRALDTAHIMYMMRL